MATSSVVAPFPIKNMIPASVNIAPNRESKEQKIGKNFEEIFLKNCLEIMSKGVATDPLLGGGFAENVYRSFLNDYLAKKITDGGGMGIAPLITQELITLQRSTYQRNI